MSRTVGLLLALAALMSGPGIALAQGPGSHAEWRTAFGGALLVDANYYASDGCQTVLEAGGGAPGGVAVDRDAIPVTVVVGPDPQGCSGERVVRRRFAVGGSRNRSLVQIFFVGVDGRILDAEKVSIASY